MGDSSYDLGGVEASPAITRILFVDDDDTLREAIERMLARAGYICELAEDGENGLFALLEGNYDVVVTDIRMPVMNGMEMLEAARARGVRLPPTIVLSGYHDYDERMLTGAGVSIILSKPVRSGTLRRHIEELVSSPPNVPVPG